MSNENKITDEDLKKKVEEAQKEEQKNNEANEANEANETDRIEELTNALARAMADLQNYKRRTEEDQSKFIKFANAEMLKILLPIIDNFNRSTDHLPEDLKNNDWTKGIMQIHDELMKTLEKIGVKKIKTVGEVLNPNLHEGLMAGTGKKDVIIEEFEPGYTLNNQVIKVAKVKVGDGSEK